MTRLVIVGEAPGGTGNIACPPLIPVPATSTAGRLAAMMGLSRHEFLFGRDPVIERHNLFNTADEGKRWNYKEAGRRAERLAHSFIDGDRVILLGSKVAWAFDLLNLDYFEWHTQLVEGGSIEVAFVPHPSGRNRVLNDPVRRAAMERFLRAATGR